MRYADPKTDPCEWWRERKSIFPNLSDLVQKYLHIPETSVSSERFFSDTGNHITIRRTRLILTSYIIWCF